MIIKGETKIILTDKSGKREVYRDTNMITNALVEHLENCGFLNTPNVNQNNLIEQLLGGIMAFDNTITENASQTFVPAGLRMTANGCVGVDNDGIPLELGSYNDVQSGWINGKYVQTYDYTYTQANGTIACVCLTGKDWGYVGEGNSLENSGVASTQKQPSLYGTPTNYRILGVPCRLSLTDSSIYGIDFSDVSNGNITIRKYRLPIDEINLQGTQTAPYVLSETTISAPTGFPAVEDSSSYVPCVSRGTVYDTGETLAILSVNTEGSTWGSGYTQTLWEIDPVTATITTSTLANTSGDTLHAMCFPIWFGKDKVAFIDGYDGYTYGSSYGLRDGRKIYSMSRTGGTWGNMRSCTNPIGVNTENNDCGWISPNRVTSGRALVYGGTGDIMYDFTLNEAYQVNGYHNNRIQESLDAPMIGYKAYSSYESGVIYYQLNLYRHESYIATINNLATPITKTAQKTMVIVYTLTFLDTDTTSS